MEMNLESFGVVQVGVGPLLVTWQYDETETEPPSSKFDKPAIKIMFQVTQIVRFLLERGLRFRNLGFCGHDLMYSKQRPSMHLYRPARFQGPAFFTPLLEGHGAFVCDQDPALTVRIRDLNRRFGGLHWQVSSRLRFACCRRRYRGASCS